MVKKGTEFSKYATAFFEVIYGSKSGKAIFVKELLKLGLTNEDKEYLDETFPMVKNSKGKSFIEKNKADQLRKYLRGDNDISEIVSNFETEFDLDFRERYCDDLQWYDEEKIIAFAHSLNIAVDTDDFDEISEAIAEYYSSVIENASAKKSRNGKKLKDEPESDRHKIALSYTLEESEKKALVKLCELTNKGFYKLKNQVDKLLKKQFELMNLTDSEKDKLKPLHEKEMASLKDSLKNSYSEIENLCTDTIKLLELKKGIHASLGIIISIASNVISDKYNVKCLEKLNYNGFSLMISRFNNNYDKILRDIDNL